MDKEELILNDYYRKYCLENRFDIDDLLTPGGSIPMPKRVEYEPDETILTIYSDYPETYGAIFACLHDRLNKLMASMKRRKDNNDLYFTAAESKELIEIINDLEKFTANLSKLGIKVRIEETYRQFLDECKAFLQPSGSSAIPENIEISIIEYDPVFSVSGVISEKRPGKLDIKFDNEYQTKQAKKLVSMAEKDQVRAIGMAKEYIEACFHTVLQGRTQLNLDKAKLAELLREARTVFNLNDSTNTEVKKIISGVSNVVNGIAELRNHKGGGHSHTIKIPPPSKIEAQLAVDAAITVVNFFWRLNERDNLNQKQ